jgi:cytochrome P450
MGSSAVSFNPRVKAYEKLPKQTTVFKERYFWYSIIALNDIRFLSSSVFDSLEKPQRTLRASVVYGEEALQFQVGDRAKRDRQRIVKALAGGDRQELQRIFHPILNNAAIRLRDRCLESQMEFGGLSTEDEMLRASLEAMTELCLGVRPEGEVLKNLTQFVAIGHHPLFAYMGGAKLMKLLSFQTVRSVNKFIQTQIEARESSTGSAREDILQMLLDNVEKEQIIEGAPRNEWVRDQLKSFIFAGTVATAQTLCWAMALLSLNPTIQERIREELDDVIPNEPNHEERPPSLDELPKLKFLEAFQKEVLRLFPVNCFVSRRTGSEQREIAGVVVPPGTLVRVDLMSLHRREDYFSQPNDFLPDRWLAESSTRDGKSKPTADPNAYCPFGVGARMCIAKHLSTFHIKMIVATLLRNHKILPYDRKQSIPDAYLVRGLLKCSPGFDIQIFGRHEE